MSCTLANGRGLECRESIGGIKNIFIVNNNAMGAYTISASGELEDLGDPSSAYKYALNPQGSDFDEAIIVSEENGTIFYEQTLNVSLPNLSVTALKELKILTHGRFQIFVEDNNINEETGFGDLYLAGAYNGMTATGGNVGRGKAYGDMNGYNITFTGREQRAALVVAPASSAGDTLFAGLTTTANEPSIVTS